MIQVCYGPDHQGDRIFGEKEPLEDKRLTHGLCPPCHKKEIEKIKKFLGEPLDLRIRKEG